MVVVPARGVEHLPVEAVESGDVRPRRGVEQADGGDDDLRLVLPARCVSQPPARPILVPTGGDDLGRGPHLAADIESVVAVLDVAEDLGLGGIRAGPVGVRCVGQAVQVRRDIAGRARVAVGSPGAADTVVAFEQHHVVHADPGQLVGHGQTTEACADDRYFAALDLAAIRGVCGSGGGVGGDSVHRCTCSSAANLRSLLLIGHR